MPEYVGHAKDIAAQEAERREGKLPEHLKAVLSAVGDAAALAGTTQFGSAVFANKPGDGSAREQAASCQKVLGGFANICYELCDEALSFELHQLGHPAVHDRRRHPV